MLKFGDKGDAYASDAAFLQKAFSSAFPGFFCPLRSSCKSHILTKKQKNPSPCLLIISKQRDERLYIHSPVVPPTFRKPEPIAVQVVTVTSGCVQCYIQINSSSAPRITHVMRRPATKIRRLSLPCSPSVLGEVIRPLIKRILTALGIPLWSCGYGVLGPVIKSVILFKKTTLVDYSQRIIF